LELKVIDVNRCNELIDGDEPETQPEVMFITAFQAAANGEDLNEVLIELDDKFNLADAQDLEMLVAGYGAGQKQRKIDLGIKEDIH
jgi:hypothetical protein